MGVLARLIDRMRPAARPEVRYAAAFGTGPVSTTSNLVNAHMAENLATVTACVEVITGTLATLPAYVFKRLPTGREEAPGHPVSALVRAPNPRQTWPDWVAQTVASALVWGNALSVVERDADGAPTALVPIPWQNVSVQMLPSGRLCFDVLAIALPWGGTGGLRRLMDDEVFWLKGRSDDGYLGRSVLSRAPAVLAAASGAQTFAAAIWANSAAPSGALTHPGRLNESARSYLAEQFNERFSGAANARRTMILDEGMRYDPLGAVSPEDAEVLASRRYSGEELARLFNVPPPLIGDLSHGSFSNVETANRFFATYCLAPWARRIECEFSRSVFGEADPGHHLMVDMAGLQRGDEAGRWATYAIAIDKQVLSVNEVRALEGWNPVPTPDEPVPGIDPP